MSDRETPRKADQHKNAMSMSRWPIGRKLSGLLLVIAGLFGFLPVLGFWMIPLGLALIFSDGMFKGRKNKGQNPGEEAEQPDRQTRDPQ